MMRTFALAIAGVLFASVTAFAQVSSIRVIEAPPTNVLLGPRTVTPAIVACTDVPAAAAAVAPLRIVAAQAGDLHTAYATGEIVVINGGTPEGVAPGRRYFTRRLQTSLAAERPSAATPGAIRTTGWLTIIAADDRFALARIEYACDAVSQNDYLDPYLEPALPTSAGADGPLNFADMGRVLFGVDRRHTFGSGDLTNIDRGRVHGVSAGTRVAIYRDRENGAPLVEMGAGVVVEASETTSKVVLVRTIDAVWRGDYVVLRAAAP